MRILFTGGGTGGHVFPIVAVKQAFKEPAAFYYLGSDGFAKKHLANLGIKIRFIQAGKFRRYFSLMIFVDLLKIVIGIIQSFWYLFLWVPDVIFSKGGYGSFPVVFVASIYRIPVILHESDSGPGLANRVSARFAKKIILSFVGSEEYFSKYKKKLVLIGNPVRKEITQGSKEQGKATFKLTSGKPVILIVGGSQGAQKINEVVLNTLPRLLEMAEIIHVTGEKNFKSIQTDAQDILEPHQNLKQHYHVYPFFDLEQMKQGHAVADLIVNRAGAGSIFEIAACGKASILVPIPKSAFDHQRKNASGFATNGVAIVLDQANLTQNIFLDEVSKLIKDPIKLKQMGEKAKTFYNPQTPELIAKEIINIIPKH
jgi:UDP-N-acetylglucosamine--N-acetylmuramyl-(pentapeptide) pyrophosphoryl-undecaprenol N-acetylglucosamine transferase